MAIKKLVEFEWIIAQDSFSDWWVEAHGDFGGFGLLSFRFISKSRAIAFCRRNGFKFKVVP